MRRHLICLSAIWLTAFIPDVVLAQDQYPNRTVKLVVPTSPGATTDTLARAIGQALSQVWQQPVIIDNRPGADEMIGVDLVARSAPDGYTLAVVSNGGVTAAPYLHSKIRYDPQKDLTPIFLLGQITPVMLVPAQSTVRSVEELIALAKARPGELNYGSFGNGTYAHVAMEDFKKRTDTQMMHVPYRGAAPAYVALLRNEIAVIIGNLSSAAGHAEAGKVRIIAAAGPRRSKERPDLPTIAESGLPGFSTGAWWGVFGPANIPSSALDKIRAQLSRILETPDMKKVFATNTIEPIEISPGHLPQFIRNDMDNWSRQIKAAGITPD